MPQRAFWATQHECRALFEYHFNPLAPGSPPTMNARFYDQANELIRANAFQLPPTLAEEVFLDGVNDAFRTWALTDAEAACRSLRRCVRQWWDVAEEQALTR